eukprot:COSAG04_NODE_2711_length_3697_cov_5.529739_4_plen_162_part_00
MRTQHSATATVTATVTATALSLSASAPSSVRSLAPQPSPSNAPLHHTNHSHPERSWISEARQICHHDATMVALIGSRKRRCKGQEDETRDDKRTRRGDKTMTDHAAMVALKRRPQLVLAALPYRFGSAVGSAVTRQDWIGSCANRQEDKTTRRGQDDKKRT